MGAMQYGFHFQDVCRCPGDPRPKFMYLRGVNSYYWILNPVDTSTKRNVGTDDGETDRQAPVVAPPEQIVTAFL